MPSHDLDLKLLRYFVAVVNERSFTAASLELHLSQPALSQAIQRLEAAVGSRLIERDSRRGPESFSLTTAGEVLYEEARGLLAGADRALNRVERAGASRKKRTLQVGFSTSTPRALTDAAVRLGAEVGDVEVVLGHVPWDEEREHLLQGRVDLLFMQLANGTVINDVELYPLGEGARVAILPRSHALAGRANISLADLENEPILDASSDRDFWIANPRPGYPMPPIVGPPARTVEEMMALVSAGRGMAITSAAVADNHGSSGLAFVTIIDLEPVTFALARLRGDLRSHVMEFARLIEEGVG